MIRVTLDVNVLASGFPASTRAPAEILVAWTDCAFDLVLSEHILAGLERAWQKPYFQRRLTNDDIQRILDVFRAEVVIVAPAPIVHGVAADVEDDLVLDTALAGHASYLVTGDNHLRNLVAYGPVTILSPREFLTFLEQANHQ